MCVGSVWVVHFSLCLIIRTQSASPFQRNNETHLCHSFWAFIQFHQYSRYTFLCLFFHFFTLFKRLFLVSVMTLCFDEKSRIYDSTFLHPNFLHLHWKRVSLILIHFIHSLFMGFSFIITFSMALTAILA